MTATARAAPADVPGRLTLAGAFARIVGPAALTAAGMIGAARGDARCWPERGSASTCCGCAGHRADGGRHARLGVAGRHAVGRPRHGRHGAAATFGAWLAWAIVVPMALRQRRRQHEPDVGDGRGHLRRARHAAASERRRRAWSSSPSCSPPATVVAAVLGG